LDFGEAPQRDMHIDLDGAEHAADQILALIAAREQA
jgi:hypothetical protein